jgi:hypothetical protein
MLILHPSLIGDLRKELTMSVTLRVFDPAMCCSTGVCGPSIDPELARFAADLEWLQKQGVKVERFNLSAQPGAFAQTPAVKEALGRGTEVLPIIMADERVVAEGVYPSRDTLAALAGIVVRKLVAAPAEKACCTPKESKQPSDSAERPKSGCC